MSKKLLEMFKTEQAYYEKLGKAMADLGDRWEIEFQDMPAVIPKCGWDKLDFSNFPSIEVFYEPLRFQAEREKARRDPENYRELYNYLCEDV